MCTRVGRGQTEADPTSIASKIAQREFDVLCTINFDLNVQLAFEVLPRLRPHFWNRLHRINPDRRRAFSKRQRPTSQIAT